MKATILYQTDFHHTPGSQVLLGVFTSHKKLFATTKRIIKKDLVENSELKGDALKEHINWNHWFLFEKQQTQGLESFELMLKEIRLNDIE